MKNMHTLTYLLMVVGALNWGLVGLFDFNLVNTLVGSMPMLEKLVYILVGLSAAYELAMHKQICKLCGGK
ncbi:DUF378 domain-containing protein [Candidatus Woesebacteria bacterium]|nr:DUF378 domain-containing protein [Candidatus Woesebacteria bacterium]